MSSIDKLTHEQALVLTGFTGVLCIPNFADFHADVEKRLGHSVWTHQFASPEMKERVKDAYRDDFMAMLPEVAQ